MQYLNDQEKKALNYFTDKVKEALKENLILFKLFGSKARGDFDEESDIDVLVLVNERDWDLHYLVCSIANDISIDLEVFISPTILTLNEYNLNKEHGTAFSHAVEEEGIFV